MPGLLREENPRICIIGAGFSGMLAAIRLEKDLNLRNVEIFEMNKSVGGTWLNNSYPGAECDIPIHGYCFDFEKRPDWRAQYASQAEILEYLNQIAEKYDLNRRTFFQHKIKRMIWDKQLSQWILDIEDLESGRLFERTFDLVFNATGSLRVPKVPEEFKEFKGDIVHTALWDHSVPLTGRTVAVIGTGASGIQVIPQLAKVAKKLIVYQRTPSWILPRLNFEFPTPVKWIFKIPGLLAIYKLMLFLMFETLWNAYTKGGTLTSKFMTWACNYTRRSQLKGNKDLYEKMSPKYDFGCKRIGFASNYYPAFLLPTTSLVTSGIRKVGTNSILTADGEEQIDVLVLATGFKVTDYFAPMEMYDREGENVLLKWKKEGPSLFLGIAGNYLPNQFILYGPNTSTGHNSVVATVEMQMDWVVKCLREMLRRNARVVAIKKSAEVAYMEDINAQFPKMVWSASACSPWYADERGAIVGLYPYNLLSYNKTIRDFQIKNLEFH